MSGASDYTASTDEMFAAFRTVWEASSAAIAGYVPEVRWQGVEETTPPDVTKYWARVSRQTVAEEQASVGAMQNGAHMYESAGLIFVQMFGPATDAQVWAKLKSLGNLAKTAFRGRKTASGVRFYNVRIRELEPENRQQRLNVVAEFEYDEIG